MVELIPKAKRPQTKYPIVDILFRVSSGLVLLAFFVYGVMFVFHQQRLSALAKVNEKIRGLLGKEEQKIFDEIVGYNDRIERSKEIARDIVRPLSVVSMLESSIHPKVRIVEFSSSLEDKRGTLALEAESLSVFWEQMRTFRKSAYIEKIDVARLVLGKRGEIIFDVTVIFKFSPNIFVWGQSSR